MAAAPPLRLAPEWDGRFTRMMGVSAVAHVLVIGAAIAIAERTPPPPLPLVAYTVQITDANALGGRLPPGAPARDLSGGAPNAPAAPPKEQPAAKAPEPEAKAPEAQAKSEPAPPEPKVEPPPATVPPPPKAPEAKPPEPAPVVKPEPKPEPKPVPEAKVEPKPAPKPEPKPEAKPVAKAPEPAKPAAKATQAAKAEPTPPAKAQGAATSQHGAKVGETNAPPRDAYAAIAERWKNRSGGGLGGNDAGSGPVGAGGDGKGGGGQLVGLEFLAYRQQVINLIHQRWTNAVTQPGLVAVVIFALAADGKISDVRLQKSSGNAAYDSSALRAVQIAGPLPPPPARYQKDFEEFQIEFHPEERGGGETG